MGDPTSMEHPVSMVSSLKPTGTQGLKMQGPGEGTFAKINEYVHDPARPEKLGFLYTTFSHYYPPISIPFSKDKHPILLNYHGKSTQFEQNWVLLR